jgi:hypothetical protein
MNMGPHSWANRYWAKVDVREADQCWHWLASRNNKGYGSFWLDGKLAKAHRVAWELEYGAIPIGQCVCHVCDCSSCVNPNHLWLGTNADNIKDRDQKGRRAPPQGTKNGRAKVTSSDVLQIRELYANGAYTYRELGVRFGLSREGIGHIVRRERWAWLDKSFKELTDA